MANMSLGLFNDTGYQLLWGETELTGKRDQAMFFAGSGWKILDVSYAKCLKKNAESWL